MFSGKQKAVGVIGLGIIGSRVAGILRSAGLHTYVWNRSPKPDPDFVESPAEMAKLADWIQIFVTDGEAVLEVLEAMLPALTPRHHILVHATVHPAEMCEAAELVQKTGASLLDAPFTGSREAAAGGELCYYLAGDAEAVDRVRPLLEISANGIVFVGRLGNASTLKVATNMITAATVQALAEALALVRSSGLHGRRLRAALEKNACRSTLTDMKLAAMLEGDYAPRFSLKNMAKDAAIALALAKEYGLEVPALRSAAGALRGAKEKGRGEEDFSVLAEAFAQLENTSDDDRK